MLQIKSNVTEMKNTFEGLTSRLDLAEERISELENRLIETSKTEKQRERRLGVGGGEGKKRKKRTEYPRTMGQLQKV